MRESKSAKRTGRGGKRSGTKKVAGRSGRPSAAGRGKGARGARIAHRALRKRVVGRASQRKGSLKLGSGDACGARLELVERAGRECDRISGGCEVQISLEAGGRASGRTDAKRGLGRAVGGLPRISAHTCRALAAAGHTQRAALLRKLLQGPATYRALQKVTKLKAGPLYHHVNHLRLAGLILPKQRDLYELTRGGRNLILTVMAMRPLIRDSRRRPLAH